jgi:hypothetical protein
MKLKIVDESEQGAGALRMKIVRCFLYHGRSWQRRHLLPDDPPRILR